jgi:hypothetical protein
VTVSEEPSTEQCLSTIDELVDLLRGEIGLLERGDLTLINDTLDRKRALLERVEAITPKLQTELSRNTGLSGLIRVRLKGVRDLLERNMTMIQGLTAATSSIREELTRIEARHSLRGLYGADGQKRDGQVRTRQQIDRTF